MQCYNINNPAYSSIGTRLPASRGGRVRPSAPDRGYPVPGRPVRSNDRRRDEGARATSREISMAEDGSYSRGRSRDRRSPQLRTIFVAAHENGPRSVRDRRGAGLLYVRWRHALRRQYHPRSREGAIRRGRRFEWNVTEPDIHIDGDTAWVAYVNRGKRHRFPWHKAAELAGIRLPAEAGRCLEDRLPAQHPRRRLNPGSATPPPASRVRRGAAWLLPA